MAEFHGNPYYDPEKCGLEIVDERDLNDDPYEFDMEVLWKDIETGLYYYGADSGCSCPTPFEDFHSLNDMQRVGDTIPHDWR